LSLDLLLYWLLQRSNFGKRIYAVGGNSRALIWPASMWQALRPCICPSQPFRRRCRILLGGYAGVSVNVGNGYEFQAISAAVIGGAALTGGRGTVAAELPAVSRCRRCSRC